MQTDSLPGQFGQHRIDLRGRGPKACVLLQRLEDQGVQRCGDFRVQQGRSQARLRKDGVQDSGLRIRGKGVPAGGQFVQHDAQGEDVAGAVGRLGPRLLRRHVADRAQQGTRGGDSGSGVLRLEGAAGEQAGQAEIDHLGVAVVPHHDVFGFDVPVHNPGGVGRGQRPGHLAGEVHQFRQGKAPGRERPQRLPLDEFHDEEGLAQALVHVVDRTDVGVVQSGGGAGFAPKPLQALGVLGVFLGQELEGHGAGQPRVLSLVDDPHPAAPQPFRDAVVRDGLADFKGTGFAEALARGPRPRLLGLRPQRLAAAGAAAVLRRGRIGPLDRTPTVRAGQVHTREAPQGAGAISPILPPGMAKIHREAAPGGCQPAIKRPHPPALTRRRAGPMRRGRPGRRSPEVVSNRPALEHPLPPRLPPPDARSPTARTVLPCPCRC